MKRDFDRRVVRKRKRGQNWRGWLAGFAVFALALMFAAGFYAYKYSPQMTAWLSERKAHLRADMKKQVKKVKHLRRQHKEEPESVHFEFYSALPAMEVSKPEIESDDMPAPELQPIKRVAETTEVKRSIKESPVVKSFAAKVLFLDPKELEKDFAHKIAKQTYIIQVATFSTSASANAFSQRLSEKQYKAEVVKAYIGERKVYRVQVGPFSSKNQLREAEEALKKQGIDGIVRKTEV